MSKSVVLAVLVVLALSVFAGGNKQVVFEIVDINGNPYNFEIQPFDDVSFIGWIEGRENEVISSRDSVATGYFSNKDMSIIMINAGYFPTPWEVGDVLKVSISENDSTGNLICSTKSVPHIIDNHDEIEEHDGKSRLDLLANEVYVEDLDIDYSSDNPVLTWTAKILGPADRYYVMKSEDPYADFPDGWDFACSDLQTNTWTDTTTPNPSKMFYKVIFFSAYPPDMVVIPKGTFDMGQVGVADATPVHEVTLTRSIFLGKYEVTQKEWFDAMDTNPASGYGVGDTYPVYNVSWYAVLKYCNIRSIAEGLTPCYSIDGQTDPTASVWVTIPTTQNTIWDDVICDWDANGFRLPTEAEWEFSARYDEVANNRTYPWGEDVPTTTNNYCNFNNMTGTETVGNYPDGNSELGLCDMAGNVAELVWDRFGVFTEDPETDPYGSDTGIERTFKNGAFSSSADGVKNARRVARLPYACTSGVGFRVVRMP